VQAFFEFVKSLKRALEGELAQHPQPRPHADGCGGPHQQRMIQKSLSAI
jgi:hypothetical protein